MYNTGNEVPSSALEDMADNAQAFDALVTKTEGTTTDRLGNTRRVFQQIIMDMGFQPLSGSFQTGATITARNQVLYDEVSHVFFAWGGTIPVGGYVVAAGSTPATSGGIGAGAWVDRTDLMLRNDLASIGGDALVAFQQPVDGSLPLTVHDKLSQILSALDFASGDGEKDDTGAFLLFEQFVTGRDVDLVGKTYRVSSVPAGNNYFNGIWHTDNAEIEAINRGSIVAAAGRMAVGSEALKSLSPGYDVGSNGNVVAVGPRAMAKMIDVKTSIAMGAGAMSEGQRSRDNIAIGDDALHFVESASADYVQLNPGGTRNIAMGGNAGRFLTDGYANVTMGRNAGQNAVHTFGLVAIGNGAHASLCPIGLSGQIENWAPAGTSIDKTYYTVAIGNNAASLTSSEYVLALGGAALNQVKRSGSNVGVGPNALRRLEEHLWIDGRPKFTKDIDGTYSQAGNVLTLNFTAHGAVAGDTVTLRLLDGDSKTFQQDKAPAVVTAVSNANQFTVNHPVSRSASGAAHLYDVVHGDVDASNTGNTAVGAEAGAFAQRGSNNTATGFGALFSVQDSHPVENTADGYQSLYKINNGMYNVAIGFRASYELINGTYNTTIGYSAGRNSVAGGQMQNFNNVTCVGSGSRISADNQVQLGDSSTTTYVYGTVQNRSDIRDKADVRDTPLGLDFIMGLRPVEGRWDMRDDYFEEYTVQIGIDDAAKPIFETRLKQIPRDGSKKRKRFHQWFIAQEVEKLCSIMGVEFGGLQRHNHNGVDGEDVMSLGYDEFIPPVVKAIQEINEKVGALEEKIEYLLRVPEKP